MHSQPENKKTETLEYIQSMLGQLRLMAQAERCDMLAYLIEMAYLEATDARQGGTQSQVSQDKRNTAT
jgi:hypothetical protein